MKFQFRTNWRGKLILQVLCTHWDDDMREFTHWEDATVGDLKEYYATH